MNIEVNDRHFINANTTMAVSFMRWLRLKLLGRVKVFDSMKRGWTGPLPFYVTRCGNGHGYFLDYPHGYANYLMCPTCNKKEA